MWQQSKSFKSFKNGTEKNFAIFLPAVLKKTKTFFDNCLKKLCYDYDYRKKSWFWILYYFTLLVFKFILFELTQKPTLIFKFYHWLRAFYTKEISFLNHSIFRYFFSFEHFSTSLTCTIHEPCQFLWNWDCVFQTWLTCNTWVKLYMMTSYQVYRVFLGNRYSLEKTTIISGKISELGKIVKSKTKISVKLIQIYPFIELTIIVIFVFSLSGLNSSPSSFTEPFRNIIYKLRLSLVASHKNFWFLLS